VMTAAEMCLYEYFQLCPPAAGSPALQALAYGAVAALCLLRALDTGRAERCTLLLLVLIVLATLSLALASTRELKDYLTAVSTTIVGVFYTGLALSCLLSLRYSCLGARALGLDAAASASCGRNLLFMLLLVIWADDTFAYFVGRAVGRRKLFPAISPKKTLEGSMAGLTGGVLVAWAFARLFWKTADLTTVILLAGLVALVGQIGDLVESAMKRGANLKDSGSVLPGHGGVLDRLDSLLFGAPVLWLALAVMDFWR